MTTKAKDMTAAKWRDHRPWCFKHGNNDHHPCCCLLQSHDDLSRSYPLVPAAKMITIMTTSYYGLGVRAWGSGALGRGPNRLERHSYI